MQRLKQAFIGNLKKSELRFEMRDSNDYDDNGHIITMFQNDSDIGYIDYIVKDKGGYVYVHYLYVNKYYKQTLAAKYLMEYFLENVLQPLQAKSSIPITISADVVNEKLKKMLERVVESVGFNFKDTPYEEDENSDDDDDDDDDDEKTCKITDNGNFIRDYGEVDYNRPGGVYSNTEHKFTFYSGNDWLTYLQNNVNISNLIINISNVFRNVPDVTIELDNQAYTLDQFITKLQEGEDKSVIARYRPYKRLKQGFIGNLKKSELTFDVREFNGGNSCLYMDKDNDTIGFVNYEISGDHVYVEYMEVQEQYRNTLAAKYLLDYFLENVLQPLQAKTSTTVTIEAQMMNRKLGAMLERVVKNVGFNFKDTHESAIHVVDDDNIEYYYYNDDLSGVYNREQHELTLDTNYIDSEDWFTYLHDTGQINNFAANLRASFTQPDDLVINVNDQTYTFEQFIVKLHEAESGSEQVIAKLRHHLRRLG